MDGSLQPPAKRTKVARAKGAKDAAEAGGRSRPTAAGRGRAKPGKGARAGTARGGRGQDEAALELEAQALADDEDEDLEDACSATRGWFTRDLRMMMYGFGDAEAPVKETVDLVEDVMVEYVSDFMGRVMGTADKKIDLPDIKQHLRKDMRKLERVEELIRKNDEIKNARKVNDTDTLLAAEAEAED